MITVLDANVAIRFSLGQTGHEQVAEILKKADWVMAPSLYPNYPDIGIIRRFSVAHELGHFCIPSHLNEIYACAIEDLNNYQENKPAEKEANEFAAELLMPLQWITKAIKSQDVSMQLIITLAEEYETSLTATALKVTTDCPDRIAVVYSNNGKVVWFKKSEAFNLHLNAGALSKLSLAADLLQQTSLCPEIKGKVPLAAWSYDIRNYEYLIEESLYMPYLNSVLTIIMIPCDEYEEELEEDEY